MAWPVIMTSYKRLFNLKPGTSELDNTDSAATTYRVSDDGLIYTIVLREGQTFTDGAPVDSYAALFTFDRLMASDTGQLYFRALKTLEIVGPYTFRLHLDQPWSPFLAALTTPMASLISPLAATRPAGFLDNRTLGSGRFEAELTTDGVKLKIRSDAPFIPKLDSVDFYFEPDDDLRAKVMVDKKAHLAWGVRGGSEYSQDSKDYQEISLPAFETRFLAFNLDRPYLKLDGVREAISLLAALTFNQSQVGNSQASNTQAGNSQTGNSQASNAQAVKILAIVPPGLLPGFDGSKTLDVTAAQQRASQLLTSIGQSRLPMDLVYPSDEAQARIDAERLAEKLIAFGLPIRTVPLKGNHGQGLLEKRDFDLYLGSRRPWLPSPELWLGGLLDSRSSFNSNPAGFSDYETDDLIAELSTPDRQERSRVLRRLAIMAQEKHPYVMLYQKEVKIVIDRRLSGISPHPMWPEVWPIDLVSLDPFKAKPPPVEIVTPKGPLIEGFDHPVAEPYE
jgi:ABC-type transport system substrate-binding protein